MNDHDKELIVALYDKYVSDNDDGSGVKVSDAKAGIFDEARLLVTEAERDIDLETSMLINAALTSERSRRSRRLVKDLDYLLDGFTEDGAYVDPILDWAFATGDDAGVDKPLRNWTAENFRDLTVTRYRVAADTTDAAKKLDDAAQRVVARMLAEGAATVGDVNWWLR